MKNPPPPGSMQSVRALELLTRRLCHASFEDERKEQLDRLLGAHMKVGRFFRSASTMAMGRPGQSKCMPDWIGCNQVEDGLRKMEANLVHMNRLSVMGELTASLAHEITQPIAAARNNARAALNFLDKEPPNLSEVAEALGCIVDDTDRAKNIVDRILDHVKKAPRRKHRFALNDAIDEAIVLARTAIFEGGVSVRTLPAEGLTSVQGDRVQLQQVILNLLLNGVEAMRSIDDGPREMLIGIEKTWARGVLVAVRDSGPGIDPKHIERVFDSFYTTKPNGVGMGLSVCRSIIEAHGGRLWAQANTPRGAAIRFTLPSEEKPS